MNKQFSFAAMAAVGVVAVAAWSAAQSQQESSSTKSAFRRTAQGNSSTEDLPQRKSSSEALKSEGTTRNRLISGTSAAAAATTSSGSERDIDASLAPFRGSSPSRSDVPPGSSAPAGTSIRIDHALVTSLDSIKLPARDAGAILAITDKKGIEVKAGDMLGQLDDRESLAKLKIAEKERDAAEIQAKNDAQIDAARKGEKVTMENLKANEEIRRKSPGALSDFDMRRSTFEWERSVAQIAVAEMEQAVAVATQFAKEAQIEAANVEIERRKIVAPIDGFINEVYKHQGEWCQPGDPVMELVRMDRLEIEGFVYASDASPTKVRGRPVDVLVQLAGGETYKASGTITFASPVLEGSGRIRQFRVSTEIDNKKVPDERGEPQWLIQPGTEAEMTIHITPPPPKPVTTPKSTSPPGTKSGLSGSKSGFSGSKVEAFKPAVPDARGKSDTKAGAKDEKKTNAKSAKTSDAKSDAKSMSKEPAKAATQSDAKGAAKADPAKTDKGDHSEPANKDDSKAGSDAKAPTGPGDSTKSGNSAKPAEQDAKDAGKSRIKL